MDSLFKNIPVVVVLAVLSLCCPLLGIVIGLVGFVTCKDPAAKKNATIVLAIGAVVAILNVVLYSTGVVVLPAGFQPGQPVIVQPAR